MVIQMSWTTNNDDTNEVSFEDRKQMILNQIQRRNERDSSFLCCSITGNPKVGKTGLALDCRTDKEIEEGYKIAVLDFDKGAEPTWSSCWNNDENIIIFEPIELNKDGSTNWEESMNNALAFVTFVDEMIKSGEKVKAFILDGVDKLYEGAGDLLRSHLAKSNKRTGQIILETDSIKVNPLDWKIRNRINDRILDMVCSLETNRFFITHMKPIYGDIYNPVPVGEVPDWHKSTPARFNQMLHIVRIKDKGVSKYEATLDASKTNSDLVGTTWTIFSTNGENEWFGIPELREGKI